MVLPLRARRETLARARQCVSRQNLTEIAQRAMAARERKEPRAHMQSQKLLKFQSCGKCINEEQPERLEGMEYKQISTLTQTDYSKLLSILSICKLTVRIMWPFEWPKQLQEHPSREKKKKKRKEKKGKLGRPSLESVYWREASRYRSCNFAYDGGNEVWPIRKTHHRQQEQT